DLRDAADLVFDGIFNGDELVFVALDLIQRRVKRSRFTGTGRAGYQHHAVRLLDIATEFLEVFVAKADYIQGQLVEFFADRLFVEDAEHSVFAVDRRHDGDTVVDGTCVVADTEAAVLRYTALRVVQLRHHLDTGDDRGVVFLGDRRHRRLQHAIDAVLD